MLTIPTISRNRIMLFLTLAVFSVPVAGQTTGNFVGDSRYLELSAGVGLNRMRDFATSPLFYEGPVQRYSAALSKLNVSNEFATGISMLKGKLSVDYNDQTAASTLNSVSIHHSRLYRIIKSAPERWNFKVGGVVDVFGNFRYNPSLMNSGVGIEVFPVLYGSMKATWDITRRNPKKGKEPKKKSLAFRVNPSIFGSSFRNGYSYIGIGQTVNEPGMEALLDGYEFKAFGLTAVTTSLDYTIWLKNSNGWRFSYAWEAYKTRKDYSTLEMASHTLRVALLFNTKSPN